MTADELHDQFREDVKDTAKPYFWSPAEVFGYMDDAYKMFVRLTGGIADFTSNISRVDIVAGEAVGALDKRILRVMEAYRLSDAGKITVVNQTDMTFASGNDYGLTRQLYADTTPGAVRYMVIGLERGKCKWVQVPDADDVAQLHIYRLPAKKIDAGEGDFEFDEIGEEHVPNLTLWMRYRAYRKADADSFGAGLADEFKAQFQEYCDMTKAEWERYKAKPREVIYGGL